VQLRGGAAQVFDAGAGFPVVAIHGLPGNSRDFRWFGGALGDRVRLVRIDLPGCGGTPTASWPQMRVDDRADFVAAVMRAMELGPSLVLGYSMGGPVAASVAVRHPELVVGLALVAAAGRKPHRAYRQMPVHPRVLDLVLRTPLHRLLMPVAVRGFRKAGFRDATAETVRSTLAAVSRVSFPEVGRTLARLRVPTLVAWTGDDRMVEAAIGEDLYWAVPPGPRILFETGGHKLLKTRAVELADALCAWVPALIDPPAVSSVAGGPS
jgi:pimeloyl-ACP methyl ester carboxylesterase